MCAHMCACARAHLVRLCAHMCVRVRVRERESARGAVGAWAHGHVGTWARGRMGEGRVDMLARARGRVGAWARSRRLLRRSGTYPSDASSLHLVKQTAISRDGPHQLCTASSPSLHCCWIQQAILQVQAGLFRTTSPKLAPSSGTT